MSEKKNGYVNGSFNGSLESTQHMIQKIRDRGLENELVFKAMATVPRHLFVPKAYQNFAYRDQALKIGYQQSISQPFIVARMLCALELDKESKVLEIGTGSGYQTALLRELLLGTLYTVERIEALALLAKKTLDQQNYSQIQFKIGDGTKGWIENAPFDRILVSAFSKKIPNALLEQLAPRGILVMPLGEPKLQSLYRILNTGTIGLESRYRIEKLEFCRFVPLVSNE